MRYNLIHPNGHVESGLSAYALRVGASSLQWKNKVRVRESIALIYVNDENIAKSSFCLH